MSRDDIAAVRQRYERFARDEAPGRSAVYAEWAEGVVGDEAVLAALAALPPPHRQPPLVFAVTRLLGAPERGYRAWAGFFLAHVERIVAECAARTTQTNEPLRCAALVYALERVAGPIALVEIGASAGLCLFPDRYAYRYRSGAGERALGDGRARLVCELRGAARAPSALPEIAWRAGIDLAPRDARDPADRAWVSGLVWPGEGERAARVAAALDVAAAEPPVLVAGDASEPGVLADLVALAPQGATVVVTTPGVLPHVPRAARERLLRTIRGLGARWVTIDPAGLHDAWSPPVPERARGGFVLGLDGAPLAAVDPLGGWIEAL